MGKRCGRSADTVVYFSIHKQQPPPVLGPFLFSQLTQTGIFNSSNFASETNLTDKLAGFMRFNGFLIRRYAAYVFCIAKNLKPELALLEVYGAFKETGKRQRIHASNSSELQDVSNFFAILLIANYGCSICVKS